MATRTWIGRGTAVAQVATCQVTAYDAATTYRLTVGGVVVSTIAQGSVNATATGLAAAWNASTHAYFTGVTASAATDTVTLTADAAGIPFTGTSSVSGGTGTIGAVTVTTANASPNAFATAANWSGETVPVGGDTVVFENSAVDLLWDLNQSALTFAEVRAYASYTGKIGLHDRVFATSATATVTTADEYRDTFLRCGATLCRLGVPGGAGSSGGSGRLKLDFGGVQTTCTVHSTAASASDGAGYEPVRLKGTHASNVLAVENGRAGLATNDASEVSTASRVSVGRETTGGGAVGSQAPIVNLGAGCTLTTLDLHSGTLRNLGAAVTTLNQHGGTYLAYGSAAHATINNQAGTCEYSSDGTITTIDAAGTLDLSRDARPKTIATCRVHKGAVLELDNGRPLSVTFSNGLALQKGATPQNTTLKLWPGTTLALS